MKHFLLIFLLFLVSNIAFTQTWPSTCTSNPLSERIFRNDVYKLALHRLMETNNTYKDSVEIPEIFRDSIARVLYAIYNVAPNPLRDSIVAAFGHNDFDTSQFFSYEKDSLHIHHNSKGAPTYAPSIKKVQVYIRKNGANPWADLDWGTGNFYNTRNPEINQLLQTYNLRVSPYSALPTFDIICSRAINTNALAQKFMALFTGGVANSSSEPFMFVGDGNSINLEYLNDGIKVTFRNGCGDCFAGCTRGRLWQFKVNTYTDCSVTYLGASIFYWNPPIDGVYTCSRYPVLPVYFNKISGAYNNEYTIINWDVFTELNINHYEIESATDGVTFKEVGRVPVSNFSASTKKYTWQDKMLLSNATFFRVKAVEKSGGFIYSNAILIKPGMQLENINITPNPIKDNLVMLDSKQTINGSFVLNVYALDGRIIFTKQLLTVPVSIALPSTIGKGLYTISIHSKEGIKNQLISVQ